jgi:heme exporter protein D
MSKKPTRKNSRGLSTLDKSSLFELLALLVFIALTLWVDVLPNWLSYGITIASVLGIVIAGVFLIREMLYNPQGAISPDALKRLDKQKAQFLSKQKIKD